MQFELLEQSKTQESNSVKVKLLTKAESVLSIY